MSNSIFVVTAGACFRIIGLLSLGLPLACVGAVHSGTGFFISAEGYIATNFHVIDGANDIRVIDNKSNVLKASVILQDKANDLAIIKVTGGEFPVLQLRNSTEIKKGTAVFTLGFPNTTVQGRESKVTTGVVSSLSGIRGEPNSFQISVPIQPGNSGGPLIDMTGAVIGVTTAKLNAAAMLQKGGSLPENVNYAVKSNYLLELIGTDRNVDKRTVRTTSQKVQSLTSLVEKAESAIVIIVSESVSPDQGRVPEKNIEDPRYVRDAQANESFQRGKAAYDRQDHKEAVVNFGKAAELGHAEAQYLLGSMYSEGRGVTKDDAEAVRWYRKAAEQGIVHAQRHLGQMYAAARGVGKDFAAAAMWYRKAAEQGDANSQSSLGFMYATGQGVTKDETEAEKWFRTAAAQGDEKAQRNLVKLIANRQRIADEDVKLASRILRAAERGDLTAQNNLGIMYSKGRGVQKDDVQAAMWFRKAAQQLNVEAQSNLGAMYATGRGVPRDDGEALKWIQGAAERGSMTAQKNLGAIYANGRGVSKDDGEAVKWYRKAAEQGSVEAMDYLRKRGLL